MQPLHVLVFIVASFLVSANIPCGDEPTCAPSYYYSDVTNSCYLPAAIRSPSDFCYADDFAASCSWNNDVSECGGGYYGTCSGSCLVGKSCHCHCILSSIDSTTYTLPHFACINGNWMAAVSNWDVANFASCQIPTSPNPSQCCFWKNADQSGTKLCLSASSSDLSGYFFSNEMSSYECSAGLYAIFWTSTNYNENSLITPFGVSSSGMAGGFNDQIESVQICRNITTDVCARWSQVFGISVDILWGSAPDMIQTLWNQYDCNHKMCNFWKYYYSIPPPYTSINVWLEPIYNNLQCPGLLSNSLLYQGCFVDSSNRYLNGPSFLSEQYMSVETCFQLCTSAKEPFTYVGVEDGNQCFCGTTWGGDTNGNQLGCNMPCSGNLYQMCGGIWRTSLYKVVANVGCGTVLSEESDAYAVGDSTYSGISMSIGAIAGIIVGVVIVVVGVIIGVVMMMRRRNVSGTKEEDNCYTTES